MCPLHAVESHGTGVSVEEVLLSPMAQVSVWREVLKGLSGGGESGGGLAAGVPHR